MTSATAARAEYLVDDGLVGGECGDEGLDGEVVDRAGQPAGDLVDQGDRVVGEQGVGASGEFEVVGEIALGLGVVMPVMV